MPFYLFIIFSSSIYGSDNFVVVILYFTRESSAYYFFVVRSEINEVLSVHFITFFVLFFCSFIYFHRDVVRGFKIFSGNDLLCNEY